MTMKKILAYTLIVMLAAAGCSKKPADKKDAAGKKTAPAAAKAEDKNPVVQGDLYPLEDLRNMLREEGFDPANLMEFDGDLYFVYETSTADEYDEQFSYEFATLLGLLGGYTKEKATVICTAGGEPAMRFTAKKDDLIALAAGEIDSQELLLRMDVEALLEDQE